MRPRFRIQHIIWILYFYIPSKISQYIVLEEKVCHIIDITLLYTLTLAENHNMFCDFDTTKKIMIVIQFRAYIRSNDPYYNNDFN